MIVAATAAARGRRRASTGFRGKHQKASQNECWSQRQRLRRQAGSGRGWRCQRSIFGKSGSAVRRVALASGPVAPVLSRVELPLWAPALQSERRGPCASLAIRLRFVQTSDARSTAASTAAGCALTHRSDCAGAPAPGRRGAKGGDTRTEQPHGARDGNGLYAAAAAVIAAAQTYVRSQVHVRFFAD